MITHRFDRIEEITAQTVTLARENAVAIAQLRSSIEQTRQAHAVEYTVQRNLCPV
jgi:phage regulator Rha-like protein